MNNMNGEHAKWCKNVIIADADYLDRVAFNLSVNFERMLGRRIPPADLAHWAVCVALDGGLREGRHQTQLVLIHDKEHARLENFCPSAYDEELNGQAFNDDKLGEFLVSSYPVEALVSKEDFMLDIVRTACNTEETHRIMVIPNAEEGELYDRLRKALHEMDDEKRVTLFAMQPLEGGNFKQEILGYSLMNALGIKADEIK